MSSELKTNKISPATGTALQIGDSGDTITIPSGATISGFGKVLQVVNATKSDTSSTSSTSAVTTGLEASITPSATSSKVLVLISFAFSADADVNTVFQLNRDSTAIHLGDANGSMKRSSAGAIYQRQNTQDVYNSSLNCLDSPSSTSSITYKLMFFRGRSSSTGQTIYMNRSTGDVNNDSHQRSISSITLMEIAG